MSKLAGLLSVSILFAISACGSDSGDTNNKNTPTNNKNTPTNNKNTNNKNTNNTNNTNNKNAPVPTELDCSTAANCQSFVFNKLLLPSDTEQSVKFGVDFDDNGKVDNQLGNILIAIASFVSDLALQPSVEKAINSGSTIILLKVQGGDFQTEPKAAAQAWLGQKSTCCADEDDEVACAKEASEGCFGGSHEFMIDPNGPQDALFGGTIKNGKGVFGPSKFQISIPLATGELTLVLQHAQIHATFEDGKITGGKLAGGISKSDLDEFVLPSVHEMLVATITEDPESDSAKQIIKIFDEDEDGKVSLEEVTGNDVIEAFLLPDVDVDGDGTDELSLGVGFEAVSATIK